MKPVPNNRPLTAMELMYIEQRVTNDGPSGGVAYLLWFFAGLFSAHRFYLGRPWTAILQILSYFVLIGFLWWLLDLFAIPQLIALRKTKIREELIRRITSAGEAADEAGGAGS